MCLKKKSERVLESYGFEFQSPSVTITGHFICNFDCIWGLTMEREILFVLLHDQWQRHRLPLIYTGVTEVTLFFW